jgi:hypothetical protein
MGDEVRGIDRFLEYSIGHLRGDRPRQERDENDPGQQSIYWKAHDHPADWTRTHAYDKGRDDSGRG